MREIKFRVWCCVGRWAYEVTFFSSGGWEARSGIEGYNENDGAILMQFTGLKDRLGKDIYEGDIIKADWHDGRYPVHTIGPVKWDEENARWDLGEGGSPKVDAQYHFEIIGNLYEHPELMREQAQ